MTRPIGLTRRRLMLAAASLPALLTLPLHRRAEAAIPTGLLHPPGPWSDAAAIGRAYLAQCPEEADVAHLVRALDQGRSLSTGRMRQHLEGRARDDFAAGRVVSLQGWVLSRTELRRCALAALA